MDRKIEIWKDIQGYEGFYAASSCGRIKSNDRITMRVMNGGGIFPQLYRGRILHQYRNHCGYLYIRPCVNGIQNTLYSHILIAKAFFPNEDESLVVNHKDGNKANNNISNLEWVTRSENQLHAYKLGLQRIVRGGKHHLAKLSDQDIDKIKGMVSNGTYQSEVAKIFNVSKSLVNIIARGKHRQYA